MQVADPLFMRIDTVKFGLNLVVAGIVLVTLATFFHSIIADLLGFSLAAEMQLVFHGLFWGGVSACLGIVVTVLGLLKGTAGRPAKTLLPIILILAAAVILFFVLLFTSFRSQEEPTLRPGETITI